MNLKQTMKFPLETPGQKNEGKSAPGRAHLGIFFFFLNPKHTGKNKPTRLHWVPEAGCWRALTRCWTGRGLGAHGRPGSRYASGELQPEVLGTHMPGWEPGEGCSREGSHPGMEQSPAHSGRMRPLEGGQLDGGYMEVGRAGSVCGKGQSPGPRGWQWAGLPRQVSAPSLGEVLQIARQVPCPPCPTHLTRSG